MKTNTTVSIDVELMKEAKAKSINISRVLAEKLREILKINQN